MNQTTGGDKKAAKRADDEAAVLEAIARMEEPSRSIGSRIHEIIGASAPDLAPRLWYGMPAYALDGKVLCFFRGAQKSKERYMTLGFNDVASLDEGSMWPIAFAIVQLGDAEEKRIAELVKKAATRLGNGAVRLSPR